MMTKDGLCKYPDCGRKVRAKGFCEPHWKQQHRGQKLSPLGMPRGKKPLEEHERVCRFPDCGRRTSARGLCTSHWRQQRYDKPLTPLGKIRRHGDPVSLPDPSTLLYKVAALSVAEFLTAHEAGERLGINRIAIYDYRQKARRAGLKVGPIKAGVVTMNRLRGQESKKWEAVDNMKQECARCPLRGHKTEDCDMPMSAVAFAGRREAA